MNNPCDDAIHHDFFGLTHPGKVRARNEDQFLIAQLSKSARVLFTSLDDPGDLQGYGQSDAHLLVVADGVGASADSSLASSTAVEILAEHINAAAACYYNLGVESEHDLIEELERAVGKAHEKVVDQSGDSPSASATVTIVVVMWPRAYVFHVGANRGYFLHKGLLRQFTRDQTFLEVLLDEGLVPDEAAEKHPYRKVLTKAVGSHDATPRVGVVDFEAGDVLLLCSDGLTRHIDDEALEAALSQDKPAENMCRELLDAALDGGGEDNVAIIVGRLGRA